MGISDEELQRLGEQAWRADILRAVRERTDDIQFGPVKFGQQIEQDIARLKQLARLSEDARFPEPGVDEEAWRDFMRRTIVHNAQGDARRGEFTFTRQMLSSLTYEAQARLEEDIMTRAIELELVVEMFNRIDGSKLFRWYPREEGPWETSTSDSGTA